MSEEVKLELRDYQKKAVQFLLRRRRAVLGSSPRTGKTPVLIRAADQIFANATIDAGCRHQIWAIVPSSIKLTFTKQIEDWSSYGFSVQVVKKLKEEIDPTVVWVVMSYEVARYKLPRLAETGDARPPLVAMLDEAHRVKSLDAKITVAAIGRDSVLKKTRATWLATGTPFPNKLIDCYSLFNFCLYGKLGRFWDFAARHCFIREGHWGRKVVGCNKHTLPELTEKVKTVLHRDTLEEVWKEMPPVMEDIILLEHTEKSEQLCEKLEDQREAVREAIEAEQSYNPPEIMSLRAELALEKIIPASDFVLERLADEEPLVVVGRHLALIEGMKARLQSHCRLATITGSTPTARRDEIRHHFQSGNLDCVLMTIQAGGEGVDMSRSSTMIIVEEEWTPKDMEQVRARIVAIGKRIPLRYFYLMFPNSLDQDVHKSIKSKTRDIKNFWNVLEDRADDTEFSELQEAEEHINWEY